MENLVNMQRLSDFYRGKRVLVTGHSGFKGSWLSLWLSRCGAKVAGYALAPETNPSLCEEADIPGHITSHHIADIRDIDALGKVFRDFKPEIVFHLAAQALVRKSYRQPRETYETNVMGTVNLLESARACESVRVVQVITSDKCYDNREWVYAYRENDPMGGFDPYSNSKGCAELVVDCYRRSFFSVASNSATSPNQHRVSLASVRAGNVIGGGDWAEDRIIPDCIRALSAAKPIPVRNPHAVRPWQHVLEPLSGYLLLAKTQWNAQPEFSDGFNFGPLPWGTLTVEQVVECAISQWGSGSWVQTGKGESANPLHEAKFLKLDITKASALLGWRPKYSAQESIQRTVQWYRQRQREGPSFQAAEFCLRQIDEYMNAAPAVV